MAIETGITPEKLAGRLNKKADDPEVARVLTVALETLEDALTDAFRVMPASVIDDCIIRLGRAIWDSTSRGRDGAVQASQVGTEGPVRAPRDPLTTIRPILSRYVNSR